jgi:hypothetical protein
MDVTGAPAAGGRPAWAFVPDRRDWLRLLGGVLFAAGALVLVLRKGNEWGNWALLATIAIPCLVLYAGALGARRVWPVLQGWQSAFFAFAAILLPIALLLFIQAVGGTPGTKLNITWVFAAAAAVAIVTALLARAWWQMLIGGAYAIVAWVVLGTKIIDSKPNTIRWLLVAAAGVLIVLAVLLGRLRKPQASDLVTAAGLAAVLAGIFGLAGLSSQAANALGAVSSGVPKPTQGWNVYLLIVSLLLIAYGVRSVTRGAAYIGGIGLFAFIVLTGVNVVALLEGKSVHTIAGWPLLLLIAGGLILALSFLLRPGALGPPTATTEPPGYLAGGTPGVPGAGARGYVASAPAVPPAPAPGYTAPGAPPPPPPPR